MRNRLLAVFALLFCAQLAAHANIYIPTLVDIIVAPTFWSMYVVTILVTGPILMAVAYIETLTIQRFLKVGTKKKLYAGLLTINIITSLFRLPTNFNYPMLWYSLAIAYILTIVFEALLLWGFLRVQLDITRARKAFKLSAIMNSVSYTVVAITLCSLIFIPRLFTESYGVKKRASGRIITCGYNVNYVIDVRTGHIQRITSNNKDTFVLNNLKNTGHNILGCTADGEMILQLNGSVLTGEELAKAKLSEEQRRLYSAQLNTEKLLANPDVFPWTEISPDGKLITYENRNGGEPSLYNLVDKSTLPFPNLYGKLAFSPDGSKIAGYTNDCEHIMVYDITQKSFTQIRAMGGNASDITWSPDGKFIAHTGTANSFTRHNWYPSIRIAEIATGKSVTIYDNLMTSGQNIGLFWIE